MHEVVVDTRILQRNESLAAHNHEHFVEQQVFVVNLMSAPGAGKTSVLEQTIQHLRNDFRIGVIEGDLMTTFDADRISALGVPALQITTGSICHLDAQMIHRALDSFPLAPLDLLFIENVGNLVCPAEFELGEDLKVMVYSTVEGAEKPMKYPVMFHEAAAVLLNKIDLLPYTGVSLEELRQNVLQVSPATTVFPMSCRTGEGLETWGQWLQAQVMASGRLATQASKGNSG